MQGTLGTPTIPMEISFLILTDVHAEGANDTLRSCALVSRQFCTISQGFLFQRVTLSSRLSRAQSTKAFYELLANESEHGHIPQLVHELKIDIDHSLDDAKDDSTLHLILLRLSTTGNLKSLAIHSYRFPYVGWLCWENTLPSLVSATRSVLQSDALISFDLRGFWFNSFTLLDTMLCSAKNLKELSLNDLSVSNDFTKDSSSTSSLLPQMRVENLPFLRSLSISAARERGRHDPADILAWLSHHPLSVNLKKLCKLNVNNVEDLSLVIKLMDLTPGLRSLSVTFSPEYHDDDSREKSYEFNFSKLASLSHLNLSLGNYYRSIFKNPLLWMYNALLTLQPAPSLEILDIECHLKHSEEDPEIRLSEELDTGWRTLSALLAGFPLLDTVNLTIWVKADASMYKTRLLKEMHALVDKVNLEISVKDAYKYRG